MLHAEAAVGHY